MRELAISLFTGAGRRPLEKAGYYNVKAKHGDATLGWPENVPFNAGEGCFVPLVGAAGWEDETVSRASDKTE